MKIEIKGLTDEQASGFQKAFDGLSEELQNAVSDKLKGLAGLEALKAVEDMLKTSDGKDKFAELQKSVDDLTMKLKNAEGFKPKAETKSFAADLREQLVKDIAKLGKMTQKNAESMVLEVKSFLETAAASVTAGSLLPWPQLEPGVSKAPDRMPYLMNIISVGVANSNTVYWTQRKTRTDNSGFVTEGTVTTLAAGTVTQSVLGYETKNASMQNLLAFIKVSNNSVDDIDWLLSEIQSELLTLMALKVDAALLSGTTATVGFNGILTGATAFSAGGDTLAAGIIPNKYDVLKFAITQIKKANFVPNYIILNPSDVRDMELERDDNGSYMLPPFMQSLPGVGGVRVIENNGMTAGAYLVGDFSKAKFWMRKGMELKIWEQNEDDAINQLKTVTLYMRGVLVVKENDALAFVTDTFADSITEITSL